MAFRAALGWIGSLFRAVLNMRPGGETTRTDPLQGATGRPAAMSYGQPRLGRLNLQRIQPPVLGLAGPTVTAPDLPWVGTHDAAPAVPPASIPMSPEGPNYGGGPLPGGQPTEVPGELDAPHNPEQGWYPAAAPDLDAPRNPEQGWYPAAAPDLDAPRNPEQGWY